MKATGIETKSISELLGNSFLIPSYQRGYRWTGIQVRDLLNDIWRFATTDHASSSWYCLQPIVVKPTPFSTYELIDGQQRLTTTHLILHHLRRHTDSIPGSFGIDYTTRNNSSTSSKDFLENIDERCDLYKTNIDYYHISSSYQEIVNWFSEESKSCDTVHEVFASVFLNRTKVIWYSVSIEEDAIEIFTRLNMGKIPLTNAELIKALFLSSSNQKSAGDDTQKRIDSKSSRIQVEISRDWEEMECELEDNELWYFMSNVFPPETRIDFIFDLLTGKSSKEPDAYYTFRRFSEEWDRGDRITVAERWIEIKRYYQTIRDWYFDREYYHKIGFLICDNEDIRELIRQWQEISKPEFIELLNAKISSRLAKVDLEAIEYGDRRIKMILLLHNIQTLLNQKEGDTRFSFARYKRERWDIEHIHATNEDMPTNERHQLDWLTEALEFIEDDALKIHAEEYVAGSSEEPFVELYQSILSHFGKTDQNEDINDLQNLVLLNAHTNRSYKNGIFPVKRKRILEEERCGTFVPPCTKNVFLKYYNDNISQMTFWGKADRESYFRDIQEVLQLYLR
ncbi:MAG: DUF262 domain-containing protein [Holosporales bacterium]|jgi:hypothetical protein|nr:DUF262 domain-containing protein [Holosporales bacterium]